LNKSKTNRRKISKIIKPLNSENINILKKLNVESTNYRKILIENFDSATARMRNSDIRQKQVDILTEKHS
jgi:hypothetical protein